MFRHFDNLRLKSKLSVLVAFTIISLLLIELLSLTSLRQSLYADKRLKTEDVVNVAYSVLERYAGLANSGEMTTERAQQSALAIIKDMRYEGDQYFWVHTNDNTMVMHPFKPQLDGKYIGDIQNNDGLKPFVEMTNMVKAHGHGFVTYQWPKPNTTEAIDKLSYVREIKQWGWIIGSGTYVDDIESEFTHNLTVSLMIFGALTLLLLFLSNGINKSIVDKVSQLLKVIEGAKTNNDLTLRFKSDSNDELAKMGFAFNEMMSSFQNAIQSVSASSTQVTNSAMDVGSLTVKTKDNVDIQTQDVDMVATAMQQMHSTVTEVAANTGETAEAAVSVCDESSSAAQIAHKAKDTVNLLTLELDGANTVISELETNCVDIGSILDVIKAISEQTNLLALNAAIEAARAGEQGRGFAVVASEVRTLAGKTNESVIEIESMILKLQEGSTNAVSAMARGLEKCNDTVVKINSVSDALNNISVSIDQIKGMAQQIATATEEQSSVTSEVSNNINRIKESAEQTYAVSTQTSSASDELITLADNLNSLTSSFKSE